MALAWPDWCMAVMAAARLAESGVISGAVAEASGGGGLSGAAAVVVGVAARVVTLAASKRDLSGNAGAGPGAAPVGDRGDGFTLTSIGAGAEMVVEIAKFSCVRGDFFDTDGAVCESAAGTGSASCGKGSCGVLLGIV